MQDLGPWIAGVVLGLIALIGLILASRAEGDGLYGFGMGLAGLALVGLIYLVNRATRYPKPPGDHGAP